jgi:hypothetical protein
MAAVGLQSPCQLSPARTALAEQEDLSVTGHFGSVTGRISRVASTAFCGSGGGLGNRTPETTQPRSRPDAILTDRTSLLKAMSKTSSRDLPREPGAAADHPRTEVEADAWYERRRRAKCRPADRMTQAGGRGHCSTTSPDRISKSRSRRDRGDARRE